jgi:hypothetical protein
MRLGRLYSSSRNISLICPQLRSWTESSQYWLAVQVSPEVQFAPPPSVHGGFETVQYSPNVQ